MNLKRMCRMQTAQRKVKLAIQRNDNIQQDVDMGTVGISPRSTER
jgi:hypothetical protein